MHGPRRVILRDVQRFEIMKVVLDLRARGHLESRLGEDPLDAQPRSRDGMQAAGFLTAARQGHIEGALRQLQGQCRLLQADATHLQRRLNRGLRIVDPLARGRPLIRGKRPQALELLREQPLLAQQPHPHFVQGRKIRGRIHIRERLLDER